MYLARTLGGGSGSALARLRRQPPGCWPAARAPWGSGALRWRRMVTGGRAADVEHGVEQGLAHQALGILHAREHRWLTRAGGLHGRIPSIVAAVVAAPAFPGRGGAAWLHAVCCVARAGRSSRCADGTQVCRRGHHAHRLETEHRQHQRAAVVGWHAPTRTASRRGRTRGRAASRTLRRRAGCRRLAANLPSSSSPGRPASGIRLNQPTNAGIDCSAVACQMPRPSWRRYICMRRSRNRLATALSCNG